MVEEKEEATDRGTPVHKKRIEERNIMRRGAKAKQFKKKHSRGGQTHLLTHGRRDKKEAGSTQRASYH